MAVLTGCTRDLPPPPPELSAGPQTETIYVIERGWHTDIGITQDQAGGALARFKALFPDAQTLVFGFGQRDYMLHQEHGLGETIAALFPGPGAMVVTALRVAPLAAFPAQDVIALRVSARGLSQLDDFIAGSFVWDPNGAPRVVGEGPYPDSVLYGSPISYSASFTCNTWTAEGLQTAGLPIRATGVVFADDVANQARRIAASAP